MWGDNLSSPFSLYLPPLSLSYLISLLHLHHLVIIDSFHVHSPSSDEGFFSITANILRFPRFLLETCYADNSHNLLECIQSIVSQFSLLSLHLLLHSLFYSTPLSFFRLLLPLYISLFSASCIHYGDELCAESWLDWVTRCTAINMMGGGKTTFPFPFWRLLCCPFPSSPLCSFEWITRSWIIDSLGVKMGMVRQREGIPSFHF